MDGSGGQWQVDVFTSRPLAETGGSRRNYLDLLDDEAVGLFMDIVPGEYVRRFPWAVGRVLLGFADDEPFVASADAEWGQCRGRRAWPVRCGGWAAGQDWALCCPRSTTISANKDAPCACLLARGLQPVLVGLLQGISTWMGTTGWT
ncbi:hypothetical protein [Streptomyces sp. RKAG290]|uniref:hypothetical protein n=1 Tax=Streptomyces sp. RKAG290 TaxID=2888348 RepID=UPI0020331F37|nr:hypothetical protein [Streptomyces sp. RKAG290]MCM2416405.1 hypothetical protein [Streptomyces sp. RKAG290]